MGVAAGTDNGKVSFSIAPDESLWKLFRKDRKHEIRREEEISSFQIK